MTLNTFLKKILQSNKFKFLGVTFMFIVTVVLFFSFDAEANEMKRLEHEVTNKYQQHDAKIDLLNPNNEQYKNNIDNIKNQNQKPQFEQLKVQIKNDFTTTNLIDKVVSKYDKWFNFEQLKIKEANSIKKAQSFKGTNPSKVEKAINVMLPTQNISKYYIKKGTNNLSQGHILVDKFIYEKRKLKIGDKFKINNKNYQVSGVFGTPMQIISQSFSIDGSVIMNQKDFDSISGDLKIELLAKIKNSKLNTKEFYAKKFDEILKDKDFITTLKIPNVSKDLFNNPKQITDQLKKLTYKTQEIKLIQGVNELSNDGEANLIHIQPDIHLTLAKTIAIVFSAILAILLTVIISKIINNYAVEIGVLKSFGYQKGEILIRFAIIPIAISFIAITIGFIIGRYILSVQLLNLLTKEFSLPNSTSPQINFTTILFGMILPFVTIFISVIYNANKLINRQTIYLLRNVNSERSSKISKFFNRFSRKYSMKRLMRLRLLTNSLSKTFAVLIGITFSSMLVFFAVFFASSINHAANSLFETLHVNTIKFDVSKYVEYQKSYKSVGQTNSIRIVDVKRKVEPKIKPNKFVSFNKPKLELLMSFDPQNTEFKFTNEQLNKMKTGILLSSSYKNDFGYQIGDEIKVTRINESFSDKTKNNTYTLKISGFYESAAPIFSFSNNAYVSKQLNTQNKVNAIFSSDKNKLNQFKMGDSVNELNLSEFKEQTNKMLTNLWAIVLIFGVIAFLILLPIISILSGIIIDDNRKNMGILKAVGYTNQELGSMMINIYNPIVSLGIIFGVTLGYVLTNYLFSLFATMGMTLNIYYNWYEILAGAILIFIVYLANIKLASRNIRKVVPIKELSSFT